MTKKPKSWAHRVEALSPAEARASLAGCCPLWHCGEAAGFLCSYVAPKGRNTERSGSSGNARRSLRYCRTHATRFAIKYGLPAPMTTGGPA